MSRVLRLPQWPPRRIVSLVPSQTECLHALGLEAEVVGITKFCVHPQAWFREKTRVGGTKTLNLDKIAALRPDLLIGNKEENERGQIEVLAQRHPVWMSDIGTLADALDMIRRLGALTGPAERARALAADIAARFEALGIPAQRPRVAYFIWRKPYMVAAGGTFIHEMLEKAGFHNVFGHLQRYPELDLSALAEARPDVVLLSSEPFPFSEKHFEPFQAACPAARLRVVDGELFSWYGSRLLEAPAYFASLRAQLA